MILHGSGVPGAHWVTRESPQEEVCPKGAHLLEPNGWPSVAPLKSTGALFG